MVNFSREDLIMALKKLEECVDRMPDVDFEEFKNGDYFLCPFVPMTWSRELMPMSELSSRLVRIGVRVF